MRLVAGVPDGIAVNLLLVKLPDDALMFPNPPTKGEGFLLTSPHTNNRCDHNQSPQLRDGVPTPPEKSRSESLRKISAYFNGSGSKSSHIPGLGLGAIFRYQALPDFHNCSLEARLDGGPWR